MSFSRLLLVAANSKKYICGVRNDKVSISPRIKIPGRDAYEGEVILCFQLDDRKTEQGKQVARSLGIAEGNQRCDGLVFYAEDEKVERVICLVEMKSSNVSEAAKQIIVTKEHIEKLLRDECNSLPEDCRTAGIKQINHIIWKACLYHHSSSPDKIDTIQRDLKNHGFQDVIRLSGADNDLRSLLNGKQKVKGNRKPL